MKPPMTAYNPYFLRILISYKNGGVCKKLVLNILKIDWALAILSSLVRNPMVLENSTRQFQMFWSTHKNRFFVFFNLDNWTEFVQYFIYLVGGKMEYCWKKQSHGFGKLSEKVKYCLIKSTGWNTCLELLK